MVLPGGDHASDLLADVVADAVAVEPGADLASNLLPTSSSTT